METLLLGLLTLNTLLLALLIFFTLRKKSSTGGDERALQALREALLEDARANRADSQQMVQSSVNGLGSVLAQSQQQFTGVLNERLRELNTQLTIRQDSLQQSVSAMMKNTDKRMSDFTAQNYRQMEDMRDTIQRSVRALQQDNAQQLDKIRGTVDEKLQKTLEERIGRSFALVSDRLEQVYKGLGEMQNLAAGVGDLKKVLAGVKTRGILGEVQLGAILEQVLAPEQYAQNVATRPGSKNVVEFAVKLPGDGQQPVYLPIDAKFPYDAYAQLQEAYDAGDKGQIDLLGKELERRIRSFAKDIRDKYVEPPYTTDFAILFLPVEGLYAEAVRRGLVEVLQRDYKVNLAGPTTMAALLNSLQMGFKTLAIQKRSGEVWQVLGAVKTEFAKFEQALTATRQRLEQAGNELDNLVGVRTRQIRRKLKDVSTLGEDEAARILPAGDLPE